MYLWLLHSPATQRGILIAALMGSSIMWLLAWPRPASAVQWIGPPPKLAWRVQQSEAVVLGRVGQRTNVIPSRSDSLPIVPEVYSRYAFVVAEAWKGDVQPGDTIHFARPGGEIPGRGWLQIGGDPQVREGESLVLFLAHGKSGVWRHEMTFSWFDGYVRVEDGKGFGYHCKGKRIAWLKRGVKSAVARLHRLESR